MPTQIQRLLPALMLALLLGAFAAVTASAQLDLSPYGTKFFVAFPDTAHARVGPNESKLRADARMTFFSNDTATVKITAPGYSRIVTILPSRSSTISLLDTGIWRAAKPFFDSINTPSRSIFTVSSNRPVSLLCHYVTRSGCEAFVPMPVSMWGDEYFAMSLRNQFYFDVGFFGVLEELLIVNDAPGQMIVIASEDATNVSITTKAHIYGRSDTTVRLDAGQAYLVETFPPWGSDSITRDLSGTHVRANKPIGVISGNTRTQGGFGANIIRTATGNSANSAAVEWLLPTSKGGNTFVYRPVSPITPRLSEEIIRVYATAPGVTMVAASNGFPAKSIAQGEFAQYSYSANLDSAATGRTFDSPFALRTDKPAQAMVITGSYAEVLDPGNTQGPQSFRTWAPSMSLLPPREGWISSARFHAPLYPPFIKHYLIVTADSSARVWIDTTEVVFEDSVVVGTPFRHVRVPVSAGDHSIHSRGGRFGAIAYGESYGFEEFKPAGTKKDEEPDLLHPSYYFEELSVGYAYPVFGLNEERIPTDSLEFSRQEKCDSTTVLARRIGLPWEFGPLTATLDPGSVNTDAEIAAEYGWGLIVGYRIRFKPVDPTSDASGKVTITNSTGRVWEIPYNYSAAIVAVTPDPVELLDVPVGQERTLPLTLANQKSLNATVLSMVLVRGTNFSLRGLNVLPKPMRPGDSFSITVAFTGQNRNSDYYDTIIVEADCGSFRLPVHARVGPDPVPEITGYDWRERRVGTAHDTLSFISNSGSREFVVREVVIIEDPRSAFSLVAPDWKALDTVRPGERFPAGIRFTPPSEGDFLSRIVLITEDGDTARAILHGVGVMPQLGLPDLPLGEICLDRILVTSFVITNIGSGDLRVRGLDLVASPEVTISIDTIAPFLPATLPPAGTLRVPISIRPQVEGAFSATLTLRSDAGSGDSTVVITGSVARCITPQLVVDDHDFDSIFITLRKRGFVTLRNLGGGDVTVNSMTLRDDTAGAFTLLSPSAPFVVRDLDSVRVECEFSPATIGLKAAQIEYGTDVGILTSKLRGVGKKLIVPARIRRDYHAQPGAEVTVYLELEGRLDTVPVERLDITIAFDTGLLDYLALGVDSAAERGWRYFAVGDFDTIRTSIATAGRPPGQDSLLAIRFLTRFSTVDSSEFPFTIETGLPYVEIVEQPGLFRRDPFCGLEYRLFEFVANNFRLEQNIPNPLVDIGSIEFEIPFGNHTTLIFYNALGDVVLRLVDAAMTPGVYTIMIPQGVLPAGLYYYRLRSGEFSATRKIMVQ